MKNTKITSNSTKKDKLVRKINDVRKMRYDTHVESCYIIELFSNCMSKLSPNLSVTNEYCLRDIVKNKVSLTFLLFP